MPNCSRCGKIMWNYTPSQLSAGLCAKCFDVREKEKIHSSQIRAVNYQRFLSRDARPGNQKIFDAFVAQYPNAMITGVGIVEQERKLLFHLDGKPAYYATLNPLTGAADIVSYQAVQAQKEEDARAEADAIAAENAARSRSHNAGCSIFLAVLGAIYGLFCMVIHFIGGIAGLFCSMLVLAGGISKSRFLVILGGVFSFVAAVVGFPFSILYVLFGIFFLCVGVEM